MTMCLLLPLLLLLLLLHMLACLLLLHWWYTEKTRSSCTMLHLFAGAMYQCTLQ
jgi:hypothetical protein